MATRVRPPHRAETKLTKRYYKGNHVRSTDTVKFTGHNAQPKILSFFLYRTAIVNQCNEN